MADKASFPSIALDMDFINILRSTDAVLTERTNKKVTLHVGDRLYVKESYQYAFDPYRYTSRVIYHADRPDPRFVDPSGWRYANSMPQKACRYLAEVTSVTTMAYKDYLALVGEEIFYNKRFFAIRNCPQDRWFRERRPVEVPSSPNVTIIEYKLVDLKGRPVRFRNYMT